MFVHHKIHNYFHSTPISGKVNKKHLPYLYKKHKSRNRFSYDLNLHKIMSHICRRFVDKSIKELHQYVINSDYYKYNSSFRLEYNGTCWKDNFSQQLTKSSRDNPTNFWTKEEYHYYLDSDRTIRSLPANYGNTKIKTSKNPY